MRLAWSNRKIEEYDISKKTVLQKTLVAGLCMHEDQLRPFVMKINLETQEADLLKILRIEDEVTTLGYGPYDNGYVVIGFRSGYVLIFDTINLDKIFHL